MSLYTVPMLPDELYHYGIKGQKWGVRRFQNEDRTWTAAGKERYGSKNSLERSKTRLSNKLDRIYSKTYDEYEKRSKQRDKYVEDEIKKRTGYGYDEAYEKAAEQNKLLDTRKLKYDKSLWKQINDVEDEAYEKFTKGHNQYEDVHREFAKDGEKFLDDYLKDKGEILFTDLFKDLSREYETYTSHLLDSVEYMNKYKIDDDFTKIIRKG